MSDDTKAENPKVDRSWIPAKLGARDKEIAKFVDVASMLDGHVVIPASSSNVLSHQLGRWFLAPEVGARKMPNVGGVEVVELTFGSVLVHGDVDTVVIAARHNAANERPGDLVRSLAGLDFPNRDEFTYKCQRGMGMRHGLMDYSSEVAFDDLVDLIQDLEDEDLADVVGDRREDLLVALEQVKEMSSGQFDVHHFMDDVEVPDLSEITTLGMVPDVRIAHAFGAIRRLAKFLADQDAKQKIDEKSDNMDSNP